MFRLIDRALVCDACALQTHCGILSTSEQNKAMAVKDRFLNALSTASGPTVKLPPPPPSPPALTAPAVRPPSPPPLKVVSSSALLQATPPPPATPEKTKKWIYYAAVAALIVGGLVVAWLVFKPKSSRFGARKPEIDFEKLYRETEQATLEKIEEDRKRESEEQAFVVATDSFHDAPRPTQPFHYEDVDDVM